MAVKKAVKLLTTLLDPIAFAECEFKFHKWRTNFLKGLAEVFGGAPGKDDKGKMGLRGKHFSFHAVDDVEEEYND